MRRPTKRTSVIVNADDFGLHAAVDHAIVQLAEKKRISSVSVMALGMPGTEAVAALTDLRIDLGLHVDFTSAYAKSRYQTARTVRSLIVETWTRRLDPAQVRDAVSEQLDRFEAITGAPPRFVDGHEHVHQFPTIREVLLGVIGERYPGQRLFVRNTLPLAWRGGKAAIIGMLGARRMRRLAERSGHLCNTDFCGVYDFDPRSDLRRLWSGWLGSLPADGGLLMCHPGLPFGVESDSIAEARAAEFRFLASAGWTELMHEHAVDLQSWSNALHPAGAVSAERC